MMKQSRTPSRIGDSPAVLWFLKKYGFTSPEIGIRSLARRLTRVYGDQPPPFDPGLIARELRVRDISFGPIGKDALLIPTDTGFRIRIGEEFPRTRQRFALAHEVGHSLFFNNDGPRPFRPYSKDESSDYEERLCHIFAGEILLPENSLTEQFRRVHRPDVDALLHLARVFDVSAWCLAIRISELKLWKAATISWTPDHANTTSIPSGSVVPKLRVAWSAAPRGYYIPPGASARSCSVIYSCYVSGDRQATEEVLSLGTLRGTYQVSCARVPDVTNKGDHGVLSVVGLFP